MTREILTFTCLNSHTWRSERFVGYLQPQTPQCPKCGNTWTGVVASKSADIQISGQMGFYQITAASPVGARWMRSNLADPFNGFCDDTGVTQDITDAAFSDGLTVDVNGKHYLGNGMVAA